MATRQWLRGGDVILPLGVLGAIVVVDALLPARIVVSGAFVIAAIVASAITTVRRTALIAAAAPSLVTHHLPDGARLLFYTDGLVETRDRDGAFFPLTERAAALRTGSLEDALDGCSPNWPTTSSTRSPTMWPWSSSNANPATLNWAWTTGPDTRIPMSRTVRHRVPPRPSPRHTLPVPLRSLAAAGQRTRRTPWPGSPARLAI